MRQFLFPTRCHRRDGFNLIEVTLAVAISAVGLLAVFGLLAGGITASRRVSDETLITHLMDDMFAWSRVTPYGKKSFLPYEAVLTNATSGSTVKVVQGLDANGNFQGSEYQSGGSGNHPNRLWAGNTTTGFGFYKFTWTPMPHPQFPNSHDICRVLVTVEWPINVATGDPMPDANRRQYVSTFARR